MARDIRSGLGLLARTVLIMSLAVAVAAVRADELPGDDDEEAKKSLPEWAVTLPEFPKTDDLLPFPTSPAATFDFAIDSRSLAVGEGEVRYTLVATSKSGARNVTYEGIRCGTLEMKRYAFGHNGEWSPSPTAKWTPVVFQSANRPQATLVQDFLCLQGGVGGKAGEIVERLRYNRPHVANTYKPL